MVSSEQVGPRVYSSLSRPYFLGILLLLVAYSYYIRGFDLGLLTFSTAFPVLISLAFISVLVSSISLSSVRNYTPFVTAYYVSLLLGAYILAHALLRPDEGGVLLQFYAELIANILLGVIAALIVIQAGLRSFCKVVVLASVPMIIVFVYMFVELEAIRRIGAADSSSGLAAAVNHLGHAFALSAISAIYLAVTALSERRAGITWLYVGMTIFLLFCTLLTGSRAAFLGLILAGVAAILLVSRLRVKVSELTTFAVVCVTVVGVMSYVMLDNVDKVTTLLSRFQGSEIGIALTNRLETYSNTILAAGPWALVFGEPWRYEPAGAVNPIPYPHNVFLSVAMHLGVISAVILLVFIVWLFMCAYRYRRVSAIDSWFLLSSILIVLAYTTTSGRITRVLTLAIVLGICWAITSRQTIKVAQ